MSAIYNAKCGWKTLFSRKVKVFCAALFLQISTLSYANPEGGVVAAGDVTISNPQANTVQINQTSNKGIINWQSFNIQSGEHVHFQQPNASSITLNRINPHNGPSSIYGVMTANGQVWLINPAGLWFAPGSVVNVGGLLATTANIKDQDFLNGQYKFLQSPEWNGAVINEGLIKIAEAGLAALVGNGVVNNGFIEAQMGTVVLAAGSAFTINFSGNELVAFQIDGEAMHYAEDKNGNHLSNAVSNTGFISANGGKVLMEAKTASYILDHTINMSGVAEANSINQKNGVIEFSAHDGTAIVSGKVYAKGKNAGEKGGQVKILGNVILVDNGAMIDASGYSGGGEILVGGNAHGVGIEQNALYTKINSGANLLADALIDGDGGKVVVWSDIGTLFYGNIYARGGISAGNGGWVETSGKINLGFNGFVDSSARVQGYKSGSLLLDPDDLCVSVGVPSACSGAIQDTTNPFQAIDGVNNYYVTKATLQALAAGTAIVLTASHDIIFETGLALLTNATGSFTATAANNITMASNGITTAGGPITLNATAGGISNIGALSTSGGLITLNASGAITQTGVFGAGAGGLTKQGAGTLTLSQANTYTGLTTVSAGTIAAGINNALLSGGLTISGGTYDIGTFTDTVGTVTLTSGSIIGTTGVLTGTSYAVQSGSISAILGGAVALTKTTTGTVTLSGANTYTGTTTVSAGILNLQNNTALGTTAGTTTVTSGAAIQIDGSGLNIAEPINTLAGTGVSSGGALVNLANNNTWSGVIALPAGGATITSNSGTLTITGGVTGGTRPLTVDGSGNITFTTAAIATTSGTLTKNGSGTLTLGFANTYTGATTINAGIVKVQSNTSLGTTAGTTSVVSGAAIQIDGSGLTIAEPINTLIGTGVSSGGALVNLANNNTWSGAITLGVGGATINSNAGTLTITGGVTGATQPLTIDGSGNVSFTTAAIGITSGTLTKNGSGTLTLGFANTYTGATTINAGIVIAQSNTSFGTTAGSTSLTSGAAIQISGSGLNIAEPLNTLSGTGISSGGALINLANSNTWSGAITLGAGGATINSNAGTLTISGGVTGTDLPLTIDGSGNASFTTAAIATAAGTLTKNGSGILTLAFANTYTGATTINNGTLTLTNANGLGSGGTQSSSTSIASGAAINMNFATATLGNTNTLSLAGTGVGGTGALIGSTSTDTLSNPITLTGDATLGGAGNLILNGIINGSGFGLTKIGANTITLGAANTFTGATVVSVGTLSLTNANALGSGGTQSSSTSIASGAAINMNFATATLGNTNTLSLAGTGVGGTGVLTGSTSTDTLSNPITLTGDATFGGTGNMVLNGIISGTGFGLTKIGANIISLGAANTYTGAIAVNVGTLSAINANALGGAGGGAISVATASTLNLNLGGATLANPNTITLTGTAILSDSASGGSTDTINNPITLTAAGTQTITSTNSTALFLLNGNITNNTATLTVNGAGNTTIVGAIGSGSGGLTKSGAGTLTLGAANAYTGATTISAGIVIAQNNTSLGTAAGTTSVASGASLQIDGSGLTIAEPINTLIGTGVSSSGALVNLANNNTWSGAITLGAGGATINSNGGVLTISGGVTGATLPLVIGGAGDTSFTTAAIGTTSGTLTKNGAGTLTLGFANTYTGATTINAGIVKIQSNTSLGTTAGTTSVVSGAAIQVDGSGLLIAEPINTLIGTGISSSGALINLANNNTWSGAITLGAAGATINSNAGTLTITGGVTGAAQPLTIDGSGNVSFTTVAIGTTTGTLTKNGSGTLTLGFANTFTGLTTVNNGTVTENVANALSSGALTVSGGTFNIGTVTDTVGAVTLTSGSIIGTTGVLTGTSYSMQSGSVSAILGGTAVLTKSTSGTVILSGVNTYSGGTSITAGTLSLSNTASLGSPTGASLASITSGATLDLNFSGTLGSATKTLTLNGTGVGGNGALTLSASGITVNNPITVSTTSSIGGTGAGTMVFGGAITGGTANLTIALPNAGLTLPAITLTNGSLLAASGGTLTLGGNLSVSAAGDALVLSGARFNNPSSFTLSTGAGRFLVWSSNANPFGGGTPDNRGGLAYNFKQYNATYGVTTVLGSGNGFLYTLAPSITPSLTGTVSKQYNGNATATLVGANYSSSGAVDGDTVTLNNPSSGTYNNKNVGTGKNVSVSGISVSSASNGAATVYGYTVGSSTANANIGTITQAPLTISSDAGQTKAYGSNDPASAATAYSVTSGTLYDSMTGSMGRAVGENVGSYNFTQNTVAINDGNSGGNYNLTFNGSSNPFTITPLTATASITNPVKVYGTNDPSLAGITVTIGNIVNQTVTDINGNSTPINDTGNVAVTLASLTRATGENVGNYNITASTFNSLTGSAASNYGAPTGLTGSPQLVINKASSLSASITTPAQTKIYGADDPILPALTLAGQINTNVTDWMGSITAINDTSAAKVDATLASLTRNTGEDVGSYNITLGTFNALTGTSAGNYNAPSFSVANSPALSITQASLTASIANQNKVYGADDPSVSGISVTLGGLINRTVSTWNGNVNVDDSALTSSVTSLVRTASESVGNKSITSGVFTAASGNYSAPTLTGSPILSISQASLTASIGNQSKVYGANDPSVSGISVTLGGLINRTVSTWNGNVNVDDSALTSSVTSLTRTASEAVGNKSITSGVFTVASGNYSAPTLTGSPILSISQANLTASIANQNKVYGADDPTLSSISVTLGGLINRTVSTWNGNVNIDDSALTSNVASLTRAVGETVGNYNITAGNFSAASSNYFVPTFTGSPVLSISQASLTASIVDQSKVYGANDPDLSGISVTLGGLINRTVSTWNGNVNVDDSALTSNAEALTRIVGETVGNYDITSGMFSAPSGNYNAPSFTGTPVLSISQTNLTGSITDQTKIYGTNDPSLSGISVLLSGVINNPAVVTWNGNVSINDTGNVSGSLSGITRVAGETVAGGPYAITSANFSLTGSAAPNYSATVPFTGSPVLTITAAPLTGTFANQTKVYGASDPAASGISVVLGGIVNNPSITTWNGIVGINDTGNVSASLASVSRVAGENVSTGPYSYTGATFNALTGSAAGNYTVPAGLSGAPTLSITPATLTYVANASSKTYGTNNPVFSGIVTGFVNGDTQASATTGTLAFSSSALQTSSVGSYDISGSGLSANFGNYNFVQSAGFATALTINPASLTVSGILANSKVFDSSTTATLNFDSAVLSGVLFADQVALNTSGYTANFVTAQTGTNIPVVVSNLGISGASSGNYTLTQPTGITGDITSNNTPPLPIPDVAPFNVVFPQVFQSHQITSLSLSGAVLSAGTGGDTSLPEEVSGGCMSVGPYIDVCMGQ